MFIGTELQKRIDAKLSKVGKVVREHNGLHSEVQQNLNGVAPEQSEESDDREKEAGGE